MRRSLVLGMLCGLAAVLIAGVVTARWQKQSAQEAARLAQMKRFEANVGEATPVDSGQRTDRTRIHSRFYHRYDELIKNTPSLLDQIASAGSSGLPYSIVGIDIHSDAMVPDVNSAEEVLIGPVREATAIIRGHAVKKTSQLTDDSTFVFTDYDVAISEVLKGGSIVVAGGSTIVVTRPGGKVLSNGMIVYVTLNTVPPLPLDNTELLLFLTLLPESGTYATLTPWGAFSLADSEVRPLGRSLPPRVVTNRTAFLQSINILSSK